MFYLLHVDGFGDYTVQLPDGSRCLLVFTSRSAVSSFIAQMELPDHKRFTAYEFHSASLICAIANMTPAVDSVSINPVGDLDESELLPVRKDDFFGSLRGR